MKPRGAKKTSLKTSKPRMRRVSSSKAGLHRQNDSLYHRIAQRAYELYEQRGRLDGYEVDDWLQAEREILGGEHKGGD
jgi:hypothetical protein